MSFQKSLSIGKTAEQYAIQYFKKRGLNYIDVRNNLEYQKQDIDFIANDITYEIKQNYHDAKYFHQGLYIWIELKVGENLGWWYFCKTDYFMFFNNEGNGLLIENNTEFKNRINNLMENGDHSKYGLNRFDIINDERYNGYIKVKSMRVYIEQIEDLIIKLVKRKK